MELHWGRCSTDYLWFHCGTLQASNWTNLNKRRKKREWCHPIKGELLGHCSSAIRFVFTPKTFPTNDSLTQKRCSVQEKNDVTKQSLSSIPSIKVRAHFENAFLKPLSVFVLLTFSLLDLHKFPNLCQSLWRVRSFSFVDFMSLVLPTRMVLNYVTMTEINPKTFPKIWFSNNNNPRSNKGNRFYH